MNLDDFKSAWQDQQQQFDATALDGIASKVRRKSVSFERRVLIRDVLEILAVIFVIPTFIGFILRFDSWVVKFGAAIVAFGAIQIAVVLLTTRFRRRTRLDQNLFDYTCTELRRVEEQLWLLRHIASWYVAPIMLGCFLIAWGRDPWWGAIINSVILALFSVFLVWLNRRTARTKLEPLRDELRQTLELLDDEFYISEPIFVGLEKMRMMNIAVIVVVVIASLVCSGFRLLPAGELSLEEARELAASLVQSERADGLSVGIIDGQRQFTFHLGATKQGQAAANDQTLYEIGSITKVFTGVLLADAAVGNEALLMQTPDGNSTEVPLPKWESQAITWRDIATHRSGLPRLPDNMKDTGSDNPYQHYDSTKAIEFLRDYKLGRAPGAKDEYSNFAVSWLGHMLSKRAGMTYEQLLADRIAGPLKMTDTVISLSPDQARRMAMPHAAFGKETSTWEFADLPGAGGIRSTTADMMKFMAANLKRPAGKMGDSIDLAWKEHQPSDGSSFAMGLGWMIARDGQTRWHNGQTGGSHSAMFINRKLNVGVVVLANTGPVKEVDVLAEQLIQRLAGQKVEPMKLAKEIKVNAAAMARLVGRYQLAPTFIFDVKVEDGRLMVGITNQPTQEVYPKSESRWFYKTVEAELEFKLGKTGPAQSLVLHQNGIRQTAKRIK